MIGAGRLHVRGRAPGRAGGGAGARAAGVAGDDGAARRWARGGTARRTIDELVDSPLEIGMHQLVQWLVNGVPHQYAIWGRGNADPRRLAQDTTRIVLAEREIFGTLPVLRTTPSSSTLPAAAAAGWSTATAPRCWRTAGAFAALPYESFLGLAAHELFHAWNGKRIRPAALGPFDYTRENYTRDLWVVEGITTYYTDLLLRRAGLIPSSATWRSWRRASPAFRRSPAAPCSRWPTPRSTPGSSSTGRTATRPTPPSRTTRRARWWRCCWT